MNSFVNSVFTLVTTPPGDLVYFIVLSFVISVSALLAFANWRNTEFPQARRGFIGFGILLGGQFLMFLFSGLGWQNIVDPKTILPPMDRAFILFCIIWVTWLYAFPEPNRIADSSATMLSLVVLLALGLSLVRWNQFVVNISYNQTIDDSLWQIGSIVISIFCMGVLLIRKPDGMWFGILLLALGLCGHVIHMLTRVDGNYSGIVRLAYMAAFPILLTLPQRFTFQTGTTGSATSSFASTSKSASYRVDSIGRSERRRYSTDPKTFHALLAVAAETNPTKMSQAITRAIAQTMLADLCFMIYLTDNNNQMVIAGGYDLIREDNLEGGSLTKNSIPMLANSIQRGRALRLPASSTSADIRGLGDILGLSNPGHLLCIPILTPEKESLGGILLLSPYSDRTWSAEDQAFLSNIASSLVPIIQRNQRFNSLESQNDMARAQATSLERRITELKKELEEARAEASKNNSAELASLRIAQDESQKIIEQLQTENAEIRAGKDIAASAVQLENELKTTLQELARIQNQLSETDMKMHELEKKQAITKNTEQAEVIASISQELRQPLSSIVGYTDLLLGESVGILGALQRKFVEKIKSSTERIRNLTDDMIQFNTLAADLNELKPESVDLISIIDNAMAYTSAQVREKNISMHMDVPKNLAPTHGDREAVQQILIHLLQNAGSATPFEGTIRLKVQTRSENGMEFILLQVTDSGGGIASDDLSRVFTRLYRADNVLIQGVGDTGVGLSIAKTLTEAQHGRIWVESEPGVGATFSVLLPIAGETIAEPQNKKGKK